MRNSAARLAESRRAPSCVYLFRLLSTRFYHFRRKHATAFHSLYACVPFSLISILLLRFGPERLAPRNFSRRTDKESRDYATQAYIVDFPVLTTTATPWRISGGDSRQESQRWERMWERLERGENGRANAREKVLGGAREWKAYA